MLVGGGVEHDRRAVLREDLAELTQVANIGERLHHVVAVEFGGDVVEMRLVVVEQHNQRRAE